MSAGTDALKLAWRNFVTLNLPASGIQEPNKAEIQAGFDQLGEDMDELEAGQAGGLIVFATWAELDAFDTTGLATGYGAKVYGTDGGTHTDPVTSATVDNEGVYSFVDGDGWERIANLEVADVTAAGAAQVALAAAEVAEAQAAVTDAQTAQAAAEAAQAAAEAALDVVANANLPSFLDPNVPAGFIIVAQDGAAMHIPRGTGVIEPTPQMFDYATGAHQATDDNVIYLLPVIGDSWAEGSGTGEPAITASAIDADYALMFDAGPEPNGATVSSFVDLYESGSKETICSGMASKILSTLNARTGEKRRLLCYIAGRGGTNLVGNISGGTASDGIMAGSEQLNEIERLTRRAREIAAALSPPARVEVAAVAVLIGHNDVLTSTIYEQAYRRGLNKLSTDINDRLKPITQQQASIRCFTFQPNRGSSSAGVERPVVRAHLTVADFNPLWRSLGSIYPILVGSADGAHADSESAWRLGRFFGHAIAEDVFGAWFQPLTVERAYWIKSDKIGIRFSEPVAIDDGTLIALSTLGNGKGLAVRQKSAAAGAEQAVTISSIAVGSDTQVIEITLSAAPTGYDVRVFLASQTTDSSINGRDQGARSLVRSVAAFDTDPLDSASLYKGIPHLVVPLPDRN